jgi:predicted enzyme related to lactoylglutathione lyase
LVGETARLGLWTEQIGLAGGRGGAHVHYAFSVEDSEIDRIREQIQSAGAEVEGPIQLGPGRAIYVTDPDGNVVEFWSQDMAEYTRGAREDGQPGTFRRD